MSESVIQSIPNHASPPTAGPTPDRERRLQIAAPVLNLDIVTTAEDAAQPELPAEDWTQLAKRQVQRALGTWMASLILHFILLAILALVTLGSSGTNLGFELAFSDSVESMDIAEVSFDLPAAAIEQTTQEDQTSLTTTEPELAELELDEAMLESVELESMFAQSDFSNAETGATFDTPSGAMDGGVSDTGGSGDGAGASFYGIDSEGSRFVYVIDASTSMTEDYRWERAVAETLESISMLKSHQRFLVMTYSSGFRPMMDMPMQKIDLVRATRSNKKKVAYWLQNQRPNGVTMPSGAMMVGLALNVDAIFLLSDGLLMDNTQQRLRTENRPRMLRFGGGQKTPVHTVAMDISGEGANILREIAEENAGVFRVVQ